MGESKVVRSFSCPVCIGVNSGEICDYLEKLGYLKSATYSPGEKYLWTSGGYYYTTNNEGLEELKIGEAHIPYGVWCGQNVGLFKSLAALSRDTSAYQWFTDDSGGWEMSESDLPSRYMQLNGHKATPTEILELYGK